MTNLPAIERFVSSTGVRIYRMPCEAFPNFIAYVYLLLDAGPPTLVDAGSGYGACTDHVLDGLRTVREEFGEPIELENIERILVTHGHIDHFGGVPKLVELTKARVSVHHLDRRVLGAYEERLIVTTKALRVYLQRSGVSEQDQASLMEMYGFSKKHVHSIHIDDVLEDGQEFDGMKMIHTPGHCPGQVCIQIGNVLLCADHILERITPHQAPESITPYTGLGHYLESLDRIRNMGGFDIALGGHEGPVRDVYKRIAEIRASHLRKLEKVQDHLRESGPLTIDALTTIMYPKAKSFHRLLALEEVGAHVEYLYLRGDLAVCNLEEVEREENPSLRYCRVA